MKTNKGLVEYAKKALSEKWGYVWGTFGYVLTETLLNQKLAQYPNNVCGYESFIRQNWLGRRTTDCAGLIKSYLWYNEGQNKIIYNSNTDVSANGMYNGAKEKGTINTIPEIQGICVWKKGHIGIYIGNGQVIEAKGTKYGVVQTPLRGVGANSWTHWLKCPFIEYIEENKVDYPLIKRGSKGEYVKTLQAILNRKGYNLVVDGDFGLKTEKAIIDYQRKNGLQADGIVGKKTWTKLLEKTIEVVEISKKYEAFKRNGYINVVKIRRNMINKVDLIVANTKNRLETLDSMYKRLPIKPLVMINNGLYFVDNGIAKSLNLLFTDDTTYAIGPYSKKGFLFYPNGDIKFGEFKYTKGVQMIGGSPSIIENGKIILDKGKMENSIINSLQPRTAIGMNETFFFTIAIDGRQKNMPGMTIKELSNFMLNELGCKYGINLDGGGSTKMLLNGRVYNSPTENRLLHNSLAVFTNS